MGVGVDNGSAVSRFTWRFAPTLVAVVYTFCLMVILEDVKRTEPFALLARPGGATARLSLFSRPGPWWTTFIQSFPSRKNDRGWRWTSLFAVTAHILGFMILSPLSSALLEPRDSIVTTANQNMRRIIPDPTQSLQLSIDALSFFNTIGNTLQNATTSLWITDDYVVLPVW